MKTKTFRISRDTPSLFITAVAKDRLPVFRTESVKAITCQVIDQPDIRVNSRSWPMS
jgi:hypothetical protein